MIILIAALIVSLVPAVLLYWWLRNRVKDEDAYKALCDSALKRGILCVFPIILLVRFAGKVRKQDYYTEPFETGEN